ncbi:hypothetical protein [Demequina sp. NBRC 110056]|uniref:hypothetical protein n=1 Tax=Demequina sp. NBRC 110056 TaxID=1570345 RepID=UPI00117E1829|nr:hypothetical protein [Demequina sp. NBRC 110056]
MRDDWGIIVQRALSPELPRGWRESAPWGYPDQAELAVIAGVFAAQLPQATAEEVAGSYMMARPGRMLDDLHELADIPVEQLAPMLGPAWGTTRVLGVPRMRAAVIHDAARVLAAEGVRTARDYREATGDDARAIDGALQRVRGLGGVSSEAISTMMQAEHAPGPLVVGYLRRLLGDEGDALTDADVMPLVRATARRLTVQPRTLLYALWQIVDIETELEEAAAVFAARQGQASAATFPAGGADDCEIGVCDDLATAAGEPEAPETAPATRVAAE